MWSDNTLNKLLLLLLHNPASRLLSKSKVTPYFAVIATAATVVNNLVVLLWRSIEFAVHLGLCLNDTRSCRRSLALLEKAHFAKSSWIALSFQVAAFVGVFHVYAASFSSRNICIGFGKFKDICVHSAPSGTRSGKYPDLSAERGQTNSANGSYSLTQDPWSEQT